MRLKMKIYGSGRVEVDSLRLSRHVKATKRRFERVIKRKNRRIERRFAEEQLEAERWEIDDDPYNDGDDYDDYYAYLHQNEQYEADWDLDAEESGRLDGYDDYDYDDRRYRMYEDTDRAGRVLCVQCDTTSEYDSKFCKECGSPLHEAAEYRPWATHARGVST